MNRGEKFLAERHKLRIRWWESLAAVAGAALAIVVLGTWIAWSVGYETGRIDEKADGDTTCRSLASAWEQLQAHRKDKP
jgi:hypothetical protein